MSTSRKTLAVFFGGRSPEHDVSIVTGLQTLAAIDTGAFDAFPVYVTPEGQWLTGEALRERATYLPDAAALRRTVAVSPDIASIGQGSLVPIRSGLFGSSRPLAFDVAVLCFHGSGGEDGGFQGLFEAAGIAYTGMRTMAASLLMDKAATKLALRALDIPCLPHACLRRPAKGFFPGPDEIAAAIAAVGLPCIVKPAHLGSSIGVAKAANAQEVAACLPPVFAYDDVAVLEPFVPHLVEYNVAVCRAAGSGSVRSSAIERPKSTAELLDFKQKYLSGGSGKSGAKTPGAVSEGMLSLTREINPPLDPSAEANLRSWSERLFEALGGTGAPRVDFLSNARTGEIWLNEVNPTPGSLGYFLWEAAKPPVLFTALVTALVEEALACRDLRRLPRDPVPVEARLFKRPG